MGRPHTEPRDVSPEELAQMRILAVFKAARSQAIRTGADPATAIFKCIVVACLFAHEARPSKPVAEIIADVAASADECARGWFDDLIKEFRRGDA